MARALSRSLALSLVLGACASSEPSEGPPEREYVDTVLMDWLEGCRGRRYVVDAGDPHPELEGLTAVEAAMLYEGDYALSMEWAVASGPIQFEWPWAAIGQIELSGLSIDLADPLYFIESEVCRGNVSCHLGCVSRLELPAELHLRSADGGFDEHMKVILRVTDVDEASFSTIVESSALSGAVSDVEFTLDEGWQLLAVEIQSEFKDASVERGRLMATVIDPDGALWFNAWAIWPPAGDAP